MLNRLIHWSLANRVLVIGVSILLLFFGYQSAVKLPVEVLPDLTKPRLNVITEVPGLAPEEVEVQVTHPIEKTLMGVVGQTRIRSASDVGLSHVAIEFDWGTDLQKARVAVQERLLSLTDQMPEGVTPIIPPSSSLMGEIFLIGVRSTSAGISPQEVRSLADWTIRQRLQKIPGIAEILNMGGGVAQMEVMPDQHRMQANGISLKELTDAVHNSANTSTSGFISQGAKEVIIRNLAMTTDPKDIENTVVKMVKDRPILIKDVAKVAWGIEPMRGNARVQATPGVIVSVTKSPGADTLKITNQMYDALAELRSTLPPGIEMSPLFQQKDFIDNAIDNLKEAIRDSAVMVTLVIFLFLFNFRTTFVTLMAMPLSFAITLLVFRLFGISVNSMTMGGFAVAIGMVVDDAIVDVENVYRRLRENAAAAAPKPKLEVIARASGEVRNSIFYATILIVLVFLPLLGLSGLEGKLFMPIALATILSMVASFVVSLVIIPVLCYYVLRIKTRKIHKDMWLVRALKWILEKIVLKVTLRHPYLLLGGVSALIVFSFLLYPKMGKDFLPAFKEDTAVVCANSAPGTSIEEMAALCVGLERALFSVPEVRQVGLRWGRAERSDHISPVSSAELNLDFHKNEPGKPARKRAEVLEDIRRKIEQVPGVVSVVSGPLADRVAHMLSGISAPVAIKISGPSLEEIARLGKEVQTVAKTIKGFENATLDYQGSIPQMRIEPIRSRAQAYGVSPGSINDQLSDLIGGKPCGSLMDGQRIINLVMRLPQEVRDSPQKIENILIETGDENRSVPVSLVAEVREAKGPNVINREGGQRSFSVAIKPTARDVTGSVGILQQKIKEQVVFPSGYAISYEGEFLSQQEATRRIMILSSVVVILMAFLLYKYFRSGFLAFQVLCDIPLAMIGGLVLTYFMLNNISIATLIGFIAVAGVAARNSIMLISHYLNLMHYEGESFSAAMVIRGTKERLLPVMMTALSAGVGVIPLVLAADQPGKEILHPVAVVIIGGLFTSTLLGLAVTPTVFYTFGRKSAAKSLSARCVASD